MPQACPLSNLSEERERIFIDTDALNLSNNLNEMDLVKGQHEQVGRRQRKVSYVARTRTLGPVL